ncbi:MAG: hypothetical protein EPN45_02770 [Rhizobiaceae bacterium]|nr:MAG: hypothetical protein EPN45_02770 [Rhizobiaceae bacterium]
MIEDAFRTRYAQFFGRAVEGAEIEFVTWSVRAQDIRPTSESYPLDLGGRPIDMQIFRTVFDPTSGAEQKTAILMRNSLAPGVRIQGPAIVVEQETSTVVTSSFDAVVQADGSLLLMRKGYSA